MTPRVGFANPEEYVRSIKFEKEIEMSTEAIVAIVGMTLTFFGVIAGASWWASALFSEVKAINKNLSDFKHRVEEQDKTIEKHSHRLVEVETKIEAIVKSK